MKAVILKANLSHNPCTNSHRDEWEILVPMGLLKFWPLSKDIRVFLRRRPAPWRQPGAVRQLNPDVSCHNQHGYPTIRRVDVCGVMRWARAAGSGTEGEGSSELRPGLQSEPHPCRAVSYTHLTLPTKA